MKVILLQDVAKIGKRGAIVEVPDGYAQNQLIPKRMAEPATPENLKRAQKASSEKAASAEAEATAFLAAVDALKDKTVTIATDVNEKNHLFKAVSVEDVVVAMAAAGVKMSAQSIRFTAPIKEAGTHEVPLVHGEHVATATITVIKK